MPGPKRRPDTLPQNPELTMEYRNETVRRRDRLLAEDDARNLLLAGEYGVLSVTGRDGAPYGVPLNYVWDEGTHIYIHCAPEGKKLDALLRDGRVSFCVVGLTNVLPGQFTTEYESVILRCEAAVSLPEAERHKALGLLVGKYSPEHAESGKVYIEKSFSRTGVIRLDIVEWSGKCKRQRRSQ